MNRRAFLGALGLLTTPLVAAAQSAGKVPRIGVLGPRTASDAAPYVEPFRRGMRDLGWVEGKNILIEE